MLLANDGSRKVVHWLADGGVHEVDVEEAQT
jgi:hypothetical protein